MLQRERECSMNEKGHSMSNRPSLEFDWMETKTDRMHFYTCTCTLPRHLLTGSISDCIWRLRGMVIESNTGQRETRRHTHTHSHTLMWSNGGNDHTYDREGDKTKQSQIKALVNWLVSPHTQTAARVEARGGFILLVV